MKIRLGIIISVFFLSGHLFAEEKKTIQVSFTITEQPYNDYYESQNKMIIDKCSSSMVDFLNSTFGFFHFAVGTNHPVLQIELTDNEKNLGTHSTLKEVGFKVTLKHQENLVGEDPVYWVFRPVERYIEKLPDDFEVFINEIIQSFNGGVAYNKEAVVKNLLSKIEVANDFYFIKGKKYFIIPLTEKENNIGRESQMRIEAFVIDDLAGYMDFNVGTTQVSQRLVYREQAIQIYRLPAYYPEGSLILKKIEESSEEISDDLLNAGTTLKKIFMLKHFPFTNTNIEIATP